MSTAVHHLSPEAIIIQQQKQTSHIINRFNKQPDYDATQRHNIHENNEWHRALCRNTTYRSSLFAVLFASSFTKAISLAFPYFLLAKTYLDIQVLLSWVVYEKGEGLFPHRLIGVVTDLVQETGITCG